MSETPSTESKPTEEQQPAEEPTQSPLRGNLQSNNLDGDLHDMGGDVGPASDATAAADPSRPSQDVQQAETRAVESGAVAVDSPSSPTGRDDADDPAGGDVTGSPHATRSQTQGSDDPREAGNA